MLSDFLSFFAFAGPVIRSQNNPSVIQFMAMIFLAFFYGFLLNLLYNFYFQRSEPRDSSLSRALVLLTPTLMTIFWFVQYSLPLSVGLLGALSFVRFRSPVKRAEDIAFILISLACAISCAIMQPLIAGSLLVLLFIFTFLQQQLISSLLQKNDFAVLTYNSKELLKLEDFKVLFLASQCNSYELISTRTYDGITSYVFNLNRFSRKNLSSLTGALERLDKNSDINFFYPATGDLN